MKKNVSAILVCFILFLTGEAPVLPPEDQSASEQTTAADTPQPAASEQPAENTPAQPEQQTTIKGKIDSSAFAVLLPHETVVSSHAELKNALENDNGITTVYLGADIVMQGGIRISPKKTEVLIDGINPLAPSQEATLTEADSASFYDTIYIDAAGVKNLHIRNLVITGKNFYSPFGVADLDALSGVTVTYERVRYNGPQMGYHRRGTIRFIDCTARIHGENGVLSPRQEFSEAKHLVFGGVNTIDTASSANTVFWHPLGGSFTLWDNASLTLRSPNTSAAYGVFYADGYANKVTITIGKCAELNMTISGVVAPELYVTLGSLYIDEIGVFRLTSPAAESVLRMGGPLTVEKDAQFIMECPGGTSAALRQAGGDITVAPNAAFHIIGNRPVLLNLIGRAFRCDDPASVLFYNTSRGIRAETLAAPLSVSAQQLRYFDTTGPDSLDNHPLYSWQKADGSLFSWSGTLSAGSGGEMTGLTSNFVPGDQPGFPPDTANFSMDKARILAFGRLPLYLTEPTVQSAAISGVTAPGALVRVFFTQGGIDYVYPDVYADASGIFHVPIDVTLAGETVVNAAAAWQYLSASAAAAVRKTGELTFAVPATLEFINTELRAGETVSKRVDPDWKIIVSDTRENRPGWRIYARLGGEMTPVSGTRPALAGALIFVDGADTRQVLSPTHETLIVSRAPGDTEDTIAVAWDDYRGPLLAAQPGAAFSDTAYTAVITWILADSP